MKWITTTQKALSLLPRYIATKDSLTNYVSKTPLHNRVIKNYKYINSKFEVQAYFSLEDMGVIHHQILKNIARDKLKDFFIEYRNYGEKLYKLSKKINFYKPRGLSNQRLIELFKIWADCYAHFIGYVYTGNFSVDALTEHLLAILDKKEEDGDFRILTQSPKKSYIGKRQDGLRKIVNFVKKEKCGQLFNRAPSKVFDILPRRLKEIINRFHQKYIWMGCVFFTTNKYPTIIDTIKEIKIALKKKSFSKVKVNLGSKKRELYKKYLIDKKTKRLSEDLSELSFYRTEMLSYVEKSEYLMRLFFAEIGRRLSVSYADLTNLTSDELIDSLKIGKLSIPVSGLKKRNNNYFVRLHKGEIKISIPKEKFIKHPSQIIKGVVASEGCAEGRIRILRNAAEISKMRQGEILVTYMTTPDFMRAISKAKAIITNDGGITCHAAIVSREMNKPCIIGTKIATKVLKDGDLVEVDANKGVVRILKNKK